MFIVKIQVSQYTNTKEKQILIYNKDKTFIYQGDIDEGIEQALKGRVKAYFYARIISADSSITIPSLEILREAPTQEW
jgi:hypothetical protein